MCKLIRLYLRFFSRSFELLLTFYSKFFVASNSLLICHNILFISQFVRYMRTWEAVNWRDSCRLTWPAVLAVACPCPCVGLTILWRQVGPMMGVVEPNVQGQLWDRIAVVAQTHEGPYRQAIIPAWLRVVVGMTKSRTRRMRNSWLNI